MFQPPSSLSFPLTFPQAMRSRGSAPGGVEGRSPRFTSSDCPEGGGLRGAFGVSWGRGDRRRRPRKPHDAPAVS